MCALKDRLESFKASSASSTSELQNQLLSAKDEVIVKYTSRTNSRRTPDSGPVIIPYNVINLIFIAI